MRAHRRLHGQGGNKTWVKIPFEVVVGVVSRRTVYARNCVVLHMERRKKSDRATPCSRLHLYLLMEEKGKYITKSKRIRQLEKQVSELQKQVEILTIRLDQTSEMLLRSRPRLACSLLRDWEESQPPPIPMQKEPRQRKQPKQPKQPYKSPPLLPRADLVLMRDANGHLV